MRVAVALGVGVGLRQGEVSGLRVDRIHFLRRELRVDQQLVKGGGEAPTKTTSSDRTVPLLADVVVEALADRLRRFPAEPGDFFPRAPDGGPVDSNLFGRAVAGRDHSGRRAGDPLPRPAAHLRQHAVVSAGEREGGRRLDGPRIRGDDAHHLRAPHAG
jgi:integrase